MNYLSYTKIQELLKSSALRRSEVPVEHAISLPLPTLRTGQPGYAFFAAPAVRRPGTPAQQGAPDRWWISDAENNQTLLFAHCRVYSFTHDRDFQTEELPPPNRGIAELRGALQELNQQMNEITPLFFGGTPADTDRRRAVAEVLLSLLPEPLQPQYRALAPDFFAWLES